MKSLCPLLIATVFCATSSAQNGVIPPPPGTVPDSAPAAPPAFALPNSLTPEEKLQGWRLLFDGTKLISLRGVQSTTPLTAGWKIEAGELKLPKEIKDTDRMTGGDLITSEGYYDFEFRFDWKATAAAESGVRYMVTEAIGKSPDGLEYQIIDDVHNSKGLKGGGIMRSSSLEGVIPPGSNAKLLSADPLERRGDPWNEGRIVVQGAQVQHWLNGEKVLEFTLGPTVRNTAAASGLKVGPGWGMKKLTKIALMDQGTEIAFRNLKLRVIAPTAGLTRPGAAPGTRPAPPVNPYLLPPRK